MTDIESRVSDVLTRRAQRPIEVERLRTNAIRRATRIRRRRLTAGTVAVIVAVAGVIALIRLPGYAPEETNLPLETAAAPGGIGSDPALLHFDVDLSVFKGRVVSTEWISGIGYEAVHVYRDDRDDRRWVDVVLAPTDAARTTRLDAQLASPPAAAGRELVVAGRPARLQQVTYLGNPAWLLRWQPAPDVFGTVIVTGQDEQLAVPVARAVHLDRVQRCAMPLWLSELPAGARWQECQTRVRSTPPGWIYSGLILEQTDAKPIFIWADGRRGAKHAASFKADQTIGGYPAQWLTDRSSGTGLWIPDFGPIDLFITAVNANDSAWLNQDDARWLAERLQPSHNTSDPASWPERAVG
jgi:hypothetical protein